jgi:hypothetical protein
MSHVSPAVRLGAGLWLGLLAGIAQAQSPTVNPPDGCPPTSAAKKNFGAGLLSALNRGANAIEQSASGLNGGTQQAANTANQVAGTAASASSSGNCSGPPSSTSTSTTTAPTRMAAASATSATSAAWTPPGDRQAATAGPPDLAKLPQITGLAIGMPIGDTLAIVQKLHPGKHINQDHAGPDAKHAFLETFGVVAPDGSGYMTSVDMTGPPEAQVIWRAYRQLAQPHVARATVLAALRQKYGHETVATSISPTVPETRDDQMQVLWWLYDEQGHLSSSTKLLAGSPYGCVANFMGSVNDYMGVVRNTNGITPTGWCADSFVALRALLGSNQPIIDRVAMDVVDFPLLMRATHATKAWMLGMQNQAQQQQIQRSNQVQPKL